MRVAASQGPIVYVLLRRADNGQEYRMAFTRHATGAWGVKAQNVNSAGAVLKRSKSASDVPASAGPFGYVRAILHNRASRVGRQGRVAEHVVIVGARGRDLYTVVDADAQVAEWARLELLDTLRHLLRKLWGRAMPVVRRVIAEKVRLDPLPAWMAQKGWVPLHLQTDIHKVALGTNLPSGGHLQGEVTLGGDSENGYVAILSAIQRVGNQYATVSLRYDGSLDVKIVVHGATNRTTAALFRSALEEGLPYLENAFY